MPRLLCKSHITTLQSVTRCLAYNLTMRGKVQLILSDMNNRRLRRAEKKIYEAIKILKEVE